MPEYSDGNPTGHEESATLIERVANFPRVRDHKLFAGVVGTVLIGASLTNLAGEHRNEGTHIDISLLSFENVADLRTAFMTAEETTTSEATFHVAGPDASVSFNGYGKIEAETFVPWLDATKVFEGKKPGDQIVQVDLSKVETNLYFRDSIWSTETDYNQILGGFAELSGNSITDTLHNMDDAIERKLEQDILNGFGTACAADLEEPIRQTIKKTVKVIAGDQRINPKAVKVRLVGGPIQWMKVDNVQLNSKAVTVGDPELDTLSCDTSKMQIIDKTGGETE